MTDWSIYTSQLIYAYLHGHPFVGSPQPLHHALQAEFAEAIGPGPWPWRPQREAIGPTPWPWEPREILAAASLLSAISVKVAASRMPEDQQKASLERIMDARIAELIDDYCGTPSGSPWPSPLQFTYSLAAGLSFLAGTLGQGGLQVAVEEVSMRVLEKALDPQPPRRSAAETGARHEGAGV
jgi:hypothetical protein